MFDSLSTLSLPYALALFLLSVQWLLTVWRRARAGLRPRLSYLAAPGLACLVAAPLAQTEALFGLGAALVLIAAYAGTAYVPGRLRRGARRRRSGLLSAGLVLLSLAGLYLLGLRLPDADAPLVWPLWAGLTLLTLGGLLGLGRPAAPPTLPGFALRFGAAQVPAWPDLELRFDGHQARVQNIGTSQLHLAGWSGSGENSWLRPLDARGQPLTILPRGATATLSPWPAGQHGVRVWYVRQQAPGEHLLFRADWTHPGSPKRVLN